MNTKRSIFGSARRRSVDDLKERTKLRDEPISRGAWYPDPFGVAGERWWDGGKWTRQVRGLPQEDAQRVPDATSQTSGIRQPRRSTGWYPWNATAMRYWDGESWGAYRTREGSEIHTPGPERQKQSWLVAVGYLAAVLVPLAGLALGIAVVAIPGARTRTRHGIQIIVLALVMFALGFLLTRHR